MDKQEWVVEARSLVKKYDALTVVNGLHFHIKKGECFGILGPNGAGKSSLMRMMYGSSPLTAGELFVLGLSMKQNNKQIKAQIGVVPQEDGLDPDFSVMDNLLVYARYHSIPDIEAKARARDLLRFMRLEGHSEQNVEKLSGGMKRRLVIARALLNNPKILFLDEPTTGLDPQARAWIWDALRRLKNEGTSLILTTHYMEEAENLCDRVTVMDKGRFLTEGTTGDLIRKNIGLEVVEFSCKPSDLDYYTNKIREKYDYLVFQNHIRLFIKEGQDGKQALSTISSDNIVVRKASLDDVFLKLAGHELRE